MSKNYLLDVNALIALFEPTHEHYAKAQEWFNSTGDALWGVCPFTEAGLVRVTTNPNVPSGQRSIEEVGLLLADIATHPRYRYWPISDSWSTITAPFADRIFGHQQVTDAFLLGLAIKRDGILVTFDKGLVFLAGTEFRKNIQLLE